MRRSRLALLVLSMTILGCPKKDPAAPTDAGPVAVVDAAPPPPAIANLAAVKRYADDETTLTGTATVKGSPAKAIAAVPKGDAVATLPVGTNVTEVVDHNGYWLVTFDDPKDASRKLEGWIPKLAFQIPVAKPKPKKAPAVPACKDGQVLAIGDDGASCFTTCSEDHHCGAQSECDVTSPADPEGNIIPFQSVSVCKPKAPAKPAASAAASGSAAPKAGGGAPVAQQDANGKCPPGLEATVGVTCNKKCKADADCGGAKYRCATFESLGGAKYCDVR